MDEVETDEETVSIYHPIPDLKFQCDVAHKQCRVRPGKLKIKSSLCSEMYWVDPAPGSRGVHMPYRKLHTFSLLQ